MAFLVSPIHACEIHYKKKYHLNFVHAKKLFVFDMLLILSVLVLAFGTLYWLFYDPTVEDEVFVDLSFETHQDIERKDIIRAGEFVTFHIEYKNDSNKVLHDIELAFAAPTHFEQSAVSTTLEYNESTSVFRIDRLPPKGNGSLSISGYFYGAPGSQEHIVVHMTYLQDARNRRENVSDVFFATLTGSTLAGSFEAPDTILGNGIFPFTLTLSNEGLDTTSDISISSKKEGNIQYSFIDSEDITIADNGSAIIDSLDPNESVVIKGEGQTYIQKGQHSITLDINPILEIDGETVPVSQISKSFTVIHPELNVSASLSGGSTRPGNIVDGTIRIVNPSSIALTNVQIIIPVSATYASGNALVSNNLGGAYRDGALVFSAQGLPQLAKLEPGDSMDIPVHIPLRSFISGSKDIQLVLAPSVTADISTIQGLSLSANGQSNAVKIGTSLRMSAESRYYTIDGDQLGRGPLPPVPGKETKYWALLTITNGTSQANDISLSATLPAGIMYTGRSSVSHGADARLSGNQIIWNHSGLAAGETARVNFELSFTPNSSQSGTFTSLLTNSSIRAVDSVTGESISAFGVNIDTSLPNDARALQIGTRTQ